MPIRPTPGRVKPTWCPMSHSNAAVRSTPVRPSPACGAAIQPTSTSMVSTEMPIPAAAQAAMAPVMASGRTPDGTGLALPLAPGRRGPAAESGLTPASLAIGVPREVEARRGEGRPPASGFGSAAPHHLADELGGFARGSADPDPHLLQRLLLGLRRARRSRDDRAGMAPRLALGSGEASHVGHHRLGDVAFDEGGGTLLGVAADLPDHPDRFGLRATLY